MGLFLLKRLKSQLKIYIFKFVYKEWDFIMVDYSKEKEFIEKLIDSYLRLKTNYQEKLGIPDNGYIYHNVSE